MKLIAAIFSAVLLSAPFSMAKAECEKEARAVITRYYSKRGAKVVSLKGLEVQGLTPGAYWQRYAVKVKVTTSIKGKKITKDRIFIMSSPFICEKLGIESIL